MTKLSRTFAVTAIAVAFLAACSLPLLAPIEVEDGVFGLDGVGVTLAAIDTAGVAPSATSSFAGTIDESFSIDATDVPAALRNLFEVASVDEEIGLDVTLEATSASALPDSFVVSAASLTDVLIKKGAQTVFTGDFSTVAGGTMTFTRGSLCVGDTCTYTASTTSALVDVSLSGSTADDLATPIGAGGDFTVSASFAVMVSPSLPDDTSLAVVLVSLGAVLE